MGDKIEKLISHALIDWVRVLIANILFWRVELELHFARSLV